MDPTQISTSDSHGRSGAEAQPAGKTARRGSFDSELTEGELALVERRDGTRAVEIVARYRESPRQILHYPCSLPGWLGGAKRKGVLALGILLLGIGIAGVGVTSVVMEVWSAKRQTSRQKRIRAIVVDARLSRQFIPKIRTDDRRVLGGAAGFALGFFLTAVGAVRLSDLLRRHSYTLGEPPHSTFPMAANCLPAGVEQFSIVRIASASRSSKKSGDRRADYHLNLVSEMEGTLETADGPRVSIAEAIEGGLASSSETALGIYEVPIVVGLRARLVFGDADFLIRSVPAAVAVGRGTCSANAVCEGVSSGAAAIRDQFLSRVLPRQRSMRISLEAAAAAATHIVRMKEHLEAIVALEGVDSLEQAAVDLVQRKRLPRVFFERMEAALAEYDQYIAMVIERAPLEVTCQAGCNACCHGAPTGVRACEILVLYRRVRRFGDFRDLHNRAVLLSDQLMEDLRSVSPRSTITVLTDSKAFRRAYLKYMRRRNPCVFVDPTSGLCRVYDVRPISCRMHLSLSTPQWCWADSVMSKKAVTPNLAPPPVITDLLDRIDEGLGLTSVNRILLPGLTDLGGRVLEGKPLRTTSRATRRTQPRRRRRRRPRR